MAPHDATTHSFPPEPAGDSRSSSVSEERLTPGTRLGQFTVVRRIGGGGMGVVYEAMQDQPRRPVAVKVILKEWPSERDLARFREEAELLARAEHAHIASVIEAGASSVGHERVAYIAMQYVSDARTITQYAAHHKLSRRDKLKLFAKVCRAVHWAHERGVVHRDLKPENILVDGSGEPRVIDFGIAKLNFTPAIGALAHLATTGHFVGSLPWAAPEQVRGGDAIDRRTDVYALGLVLYRLMCGTHAYDLSRSTDSEAIQQIQKQPPTRPSTFDSALKGEAERLILKALDKNPTMRYQTALELAEDVERLLAGKMVEAGTGEGLRVVPRTAGNFLSRHPKTFLALATLAAIVLVNDIGAQVIFRWTPLNEIYERWLLRQNAGWTAPMSRVRIIERNFEGTQEGLAGAGLPASLGIDGTSDGWKRALYSRALDRLLEVRPTAVVMDHVFYGGEQWAEETAQLVSSIQKLKNAGIDTVIVGGGPDVAEWRRTNPQIADHVGMGNGLVVPSETDQILQIPLLHQTPGMPPVPSLAIRALVAVRRPGFDADYAADDLRQHIKLRYFQVGSDGNRSYPKIEETVPFSNISVQQKDELVGEGSTVYAGDISYMLTVDARSRDTFASSIVTYKEFFEATPERLKELFGGRVAFLAGSSEFDKDARTLADGTRQWYPLIHAQAVQRLVSDTSIHEPNWFGAYLVVAFGAAVGICIAAVSRGRTRMTIELLTVCAGVLFVTSYLSFRYLSFLCVPWMPLLGAVAGCLLGSWMFGLERRRRLIAEVA